MKSKHENIDIEKLVIEAMYEILHEENKDRIHQKVDINRSDRLLGKESLLDSHGLVTMIVSVEEMLLEKYEISIVIADQRAMSQEKSPFLTVGTLIDYIEMLVKENL